MKKKLYSFCFMLALLFSLSLHAAAAEATEAQLYYVTDAAGLLTDLEDTRLETMAETVSKKYGVGVYMVTVDDYRDFNSEGVYEATYTIYHEYTMGEGADRNGIMLLLSMDDRDWAMFCYGEQCEYAFNSYGQEQLEGVFLDNFADDDWSGGFDDYINTCADYLERAAKGKPVREIPVVPLMIAVCGSLIIALITVVNLWLNMNNVAEKATADPYISGELNLTENTDTFTHRTRRRRKIEKSSNSGSSSGSSSCSESGGGGSGRSGKF